MAVKTISGENFQVVVLGDKDTGAPYNSAGGGGGGAGDASAANQTTQITAADLTNTRLATLIMQTDGLEAGQATQITAEQAIQATIGATSGAAVVTDATGTLQQYLRGLIVKMLALIAQLPASLGIKTAASSLSVAPASDATFALTSVAYRSQPTVTRPANVTAYTAGDVVGGAIAFTSMGPSAGHVMLTSCDLRYDVSAIPSGMTSFRLYLYNVTPPSALADNAVWDLPSGDRASYIGYVDLGTIADLGSTLFTQADAVNKHVKLGASETALYGYLVTTGAYTPAGNSEVLAPCLRGVAI